MTVDADAHWVGWHREYDDPGSRLSRRLSVVQKHIRRALDERTGAVRIISMCAGEGRDLLPVLAEHPRRMDVAALLVELDASNADVAREAARAAHLSHVEVLRADASITDIYADAVPADIILACGIFGNISLDDVRHTIARLPCLCGPGATVVWTRARRRGNDVTPQIRAWFEQSGFEEIAFDAPEADTFSVGAHRLVAPPREFERGLRLFQFRAELSGA